MTPGECLVSVAQANTKNRIKNIVILVHLDDGSVNMQVSDRVPIEIMSFFEKLLSFSMNQELESIMARKGVRQ